MTESPDFFLPLATPENGEAAYASMAQLVHRPVPPPDRRIYSITFKHDGVEWTATVGERLRGHTIANPRARAKMRRIERPVSDSAMVLAIFTGVPHIVFTDSGVEAGSGSAWENPFMAGQPTAVTYFKAP